MGKRGVLADQGRSVAPTYVEKLARGVGNPTSVGGTGPGGRQRTGEVGDRRGIGALALGYFDLEKGGRADVFGQLRSGLVHRHWRRLPPRSL